MIKPDIYDNTFRYYPDATVATKSEVCAEVSGYFPAVLEAMNQIFLVRHRDSLKPC